VLVKHFLSDLGCVEGKEDKEDKEEEEKKKNLILQNGLKKI
jgi:hypothetical protein